MARLPLVLSVVVLTISGCANYGAIAKLNQDNQTDLQNLEKQLRTDTTAKPLYAKLASSLGASVRAQAKARVATIEAQAWFSDAAAQRIYLNGRTARIQTEFNDEADDTARRAALLQALDGKLADAAKALHANGQDIQRYLDLGFFERLFTDVRGMDTTTLRQIGDDLRSISQRLAPGLGGAVEGGAKP